MLVAIETLRAVHHIVMKDQDGAYALRTHTTGGGALLACQCPGRGATPV
jgi:hypothetical protein